MSNRWTIDSETPDKADKFEWRLPSNDQQHVAQTIVPGQLLIKPEDITLIPTKSPKRSGIQHGADDWNYDTLTDDGTWYSFGEVVQES